MSKKYNVSEELAEKNEQYFTKVYEQYIRDDEIHVSLFCPKCKSKNYVYTGRMDDPTCGGDGEVCKCWSCKHEFWMMEPEFILEFHGEEFVKVKGDLHKLIHECVGPDNGKKDAPWKD